MTTRTALLNRRVLAALLASWIVACLIIPSPLSAAELKPSWHCLPEETVVMARMPQPREFYDAIRTRTKIGAVMLKPDRMQKAVELIREQAKDGFAEFEQKLGDFNLKIDDWQSIFSGELGIALVLHPRAEKKYSPLAMVLAWIEPGEDLGSRLITALEKTVTDQKDTKFPTRRIDLELAGHKVLYLIEPETHVDDEATFDSLPENFGKLTPEEQREWHKKQLKKLESAKRTQTGQSNIFLTRIGSRLLLGATVDSDAKFNEFTKDGEQAIDTNFDAVSGAEEAKGLFARFLEQHANDAPAAPLKILETAGLQQALPEGLTFVEILADPRPLWKLDAEGEEDTVKKLKAYGVDGFGPFAYRQTLDGNTARAGMFLSVPAPRRGMLQLFDLMIGPADVPGWVSNEVVQYEHFHFDLGKAYNIIKQIVLAEEGEQVKTGFDTIEQQTQNFLQTDVATLLSSIGTRHALLNFMPKLGEALGQLKNKKDDALAAEAASRTAIVWQLKDEALWQKILQLVAPFSGGELLDEQGFKGLRAPAPQAMGVFIGRGYLVVGIGQNTVESTLTALRNPPQESAAFKSSAVMRRANELLPPEPGMMYQVIDGARYGKLLGQLNSFFAHLPMTEIPDAQRGLIKGLQGLLPEDADLEGILGAGVSSLRVTADGIVLRSVSEMPAP